MPIEPDAYVAFLSVLQDAHAAGGGTPNAFAPGAQGIPGQPGAAGDAASSVAAGPAAAGIGSGGASVPGTATTGQSILENIMTGGIDPGSPDQVSLVDRLRGFNGEPGERGDLGTGVTGGDVGALLSVLGGPFASASILSSLVASDALGMDLDPSLLSANSLLELAQVQAENESSPGFSADATGGTPFSFDPGVNVGAGNLPAASGPFSAPVDFSVPSRGLSFGGGGSGGDRGRSPEARARDRNEQPR